MKIVLDSDDLMPILVLARCGRNIMCILATAEADRNTAAFSATRDDLYRGFDLVNGFLESIAEKEGVTLDAAWDRIGLLISDNAILMRDAGPEGEQQRSWDPRGGAA